MRIFSSKEVLALMGELFHLRLHFVDLFQLVLYLPCAGARAEPEDQRGVLDFSIYGDDGGLARGRSGERLAGAPHGARA